jgi:hypothetical protein
VSVEVINAVRSRRFGSVRHKAVIYVLADYCDAHWTCFVGQARLAAEAEVSERTVRTILAELETAGIIRREARYLGFQGRTSDRIHLVRDAIDALPATAAGSGDLPASPADLPASSAPLPATRDRSTGKALAGEPLGNRKNEPLEGTSAADSESFGPCPLCGDDVLAIHGRRGTFYGCAT